MTEPGNLHRMFIRALFLLPTAVQRQIGLAVPPRVRGRTLDPAAHMVLGLAPYLAAEDVPRLTPEEARRNAYRAAAVTSTSPLPMAQLVDLTLDGPGGPLPARWYLPPGVNDKEGAALIYFHGGGFATGDLETHDALCRSLATWGQLRVMAVDYRLAPEHPFPAAVDDAWAAFCWLRSHASLLNVDAHRLALGGDSAGANLAAVVAQLARQDAGPPPAFQLLLYPTTNASRRYPSFDLFGRGYGLDEAKYDWFIKHYVPRPEDRQDPRVSPLLAPDLSGLPPLCLVTAGFDLLHDEGLEYARRVEAAGGTVDYRCQEGLFHGFGLFHQVMPAARQAIKEAATALRQWHRAAPPLS